MCITNPEVLWSSESTALKRSIFESIRESYMSAHVLLNSLNKLG